MRKITAILFCAAAFATPAIPAKAQDGLTFLRAFLQSAPAVGVVFTQTSVNPDGEVVDESGGKFWHRRPQFFRMEYDAPDGIVMVSDGAQLWTYEPDLQQAIVRPAQAAGDSALLDVLNSGDVESLRAEYVLTSGASGKIRWATAEARETGGPVRRVRLGFSPEGELTQIEIEDSFGGKAILRVESVSRAPPPESFFAFSPPADADIIREP